MSKGCSNWAVLREAGQLPLQFYWFRAVMRFWNDMVGSNSSVLKNVMKADVQLSRGDQTRPHGRGRQACKRCWSYEVKQALNGIANCEQYQACIDRKEIVNLRDFQKDLLARYTSCVWDPLVGENVEPALCAQRKMA